MDDADTIEPFGFFTLDSLRAGWYLVWRQMVRVLPLVAAAAVVGFGLARLDFGSLATIVLGLGVLAASIWGLVLVPRLTIQWAEQWYGATLTGQIRIWWGVTWRVIVASLVAGVICTPPNFVAMSLTTAYPGAALGMLGSLLALLLGVVSFAVSLLATGWAMSKVATIQIASLGGLPPMIVPAPLGAAAPALEPEPVGVAARAIVTAPAPVMAAAAVAAAPVVRTTPAPRPVVSDKPQCPKCGLHETERGSVIGWYCRICGWREGRRGK
jgi:hypothetical protein